MKRDITTISWDDKFSLLDRFNPSDEVACAAFDVTLEELNTARRLRAAGTLTSNPDLQTNEFAEHFIVNQNDSKPVVWPIPIAPNNPTLTDATFLVKPAETATKKIVIKAPQKRGRKGDKITKALMQVTNTPQSVDEFTKTHGVSVAVLRQAKRFIATMSAEDITTVGKIVVKQDKEKVLMIWREDNV